MAGGTMVQHTTLSVVRPPCPIVVVAEGWPSCLVTLLSLGLPVAGGFFPQYYHRFFKESANIKTVIPWLSWEEFASSVPPDSCIVIVLGSHSFVGDILSHTESVGRQEDLEKDKHRRWRERRHHFWREDPLRYVGRVIVGLEVDLTFPTRS